MIIEKDTAMLVHSAVRGDFAAKARRAFSIDDDHYPVIITDPMKSNAARNQEADLRAQDTVIEILEEELKPETEIQVSAESESEIEVEVEAHAEDAAEPEEEISSGHGFVGFFRE